MVKTVNFALTCVAGRHRMKTQLNKNNQQNINKVTASQCPANKQNGAANLLLTRVLTNSQIETRSQAEEFRIGSRRVQ